MQYIPRYVINEELIHEKDSLIDIDGNRRDILVKRLSLYDRYTEEITHIVEMYLETIFDRKYNELLETMTQLNQDHNRYLADIIEICAPKVLIIYL